MNLPLPFHPHSAWTVFRPVHIGCSHCSWRCHLNRGLTNRPSSTVLQTGYPFVIYTAPITQAYFQPHSSGGTSGEIHPAEPVHAAPRAPQQRLVLASGPRLKPLIDVPRELVHRCSIERPEVIPPASYRWMALLRQFGQCRRCPTMDAPAPYHLSHVLQGIGAHSRQIAGK